MNVLICINVKNLDAKVAMLRYLGVITGIILIKIYKNI